MNNEEILHEGSFEDQLIMSLGKAIMEQEMKPSILDFNRMAQISFSIRPIRSKDLLSVINFEAWTASTNSLSSESAKGRAPI